YLSHNGDDRLTKLLRPAIINYTNDYSIRERYDLGLKDHKDEIYHSSQILSQCLTHGLISLYKVEDAYRIDKQFMDSMSAIASPTDADLRSILFCAQRYTYTML